MNKYISKEFFPIYVEKPLNEGVFKMKQFLKNNLLLIFILTSVVFGTSVGFLLRQFYVFDEHEIKYFGFLGAIFLRLIKLFIFLF
jgi:Na+/H+-dicarboxylate symporter